VTGLNPCVLRTEYGEPVTGYIVVLRAIDSPARPDQPLADDV
jgi:hypothetical protein